MATYLTPSFKVNQSFVILIQFKYNKFKNKNKKKKNNLHLTLKGILLQKKLPTHYNILLL